MFGNLIANSTVYFHERNANTTPISHELVLSFKIFLFRINHSIFFLSLEFFKAFGHFIQLRQ